MRRMPLPQILLATCFAASALGQDTADLRLAPSPGDEFYYQKIVTTSMATHDRPGAAGVVTDTETRFIAIRGEIIDVAEDTGNVAQQEELHHLRIEIDRPGWDLENYDSNLPKRAAPNPLRRLDKRISQLPQFQVIASTTGDVLEVLYVPALENYIRNYYELFDKPVGALKTLQAGLIEYNFRHSFGAGFDLLSGAEQTVGDKWTRSSRIVIPYIGESTLAWTCTLEEIDGDVAVITATPSLVVLRAVQPNPSVKLTVGDVQGIALLRYDTATDRPVFFESTIDIPLDVKLANPFGEFDEFTANAIMATELEEITADDIPQNMQPGGREWINRRK